MQKQLFRILWSQSRREASSPPNRRLLSQRRVNGFQGAGVAIPSILGTSETTTSNQSSNNDWIQGETLNLAADLRTFRPGDKLEIPYEMTISEGMQDFWQSVSYSIQSTIHVPHRSNSNNIACSLLFKPSGISCTRSDSYLSPMGSKNGLARSCLALFLGSLSCQFHDPCG
jgi:hypothetical protein